MEQLLLNIRHVRMSDVKNTDGSKTALEDAATRDGHAVFFPTHVVEKRMEDCVTTPIGYLSINAVPIAMIWMDTKEAKIRDSVAILNFTENATRDRGATNLIIPCTDSSPYAAYMERMGYKNLGKYNLFYKDLS